MRGTLCGRRRRYDPKRTGERQAVLRRLKEGVQISQEGSIKGENVVVRETVYHGFRERRDLSRPRYVPQGPERDRSDYVLKLDCDDRADADGEQVG